MSLVLALGACTTRVSLGFHDALDGDRASQDGSVADVSPDAPAPDAAPLDVLSDISLDVSLSDVSPSDVVTVDAPLVPLGRVQTAALGAAHSCAISDARAVYCWGRNDRGQLGDGTTIDRARPGRVAGIERGRALALGESHSCAISDAGEVRCWGRNDRGQLGDGTTIDRARPVTAVFGPPVTLASLAAGDAHSCALGGGRVSCWGDNASGQLGDGTTTARAMPREIPGISGATQLSVGARHGCAVTSPGGAVLCWGEGYGPTPRAVAGLGPARSVGSGRCHDCAVLEADSRVWCWGCNDRGQLGDGLTSATPRATPAVTSAPPPAAVDSLAVGRDHTCSLGSGTVRCWGRGDSLQLANGRAEDELVPLTVGSFVRVSIEAITAGARHSCAVVSGMLVCWGDNASGQLGDGTTTARANPTPVD